jgi:DNA-directed RNA polymerase specialized sigma24 family protein
MPTLQSLYQQATGDLESHHRTIGAALRQIDDRRRRWILRLVLGETYATIGQAFHVTRGSVHDGVTRAFAVMRKRIAGEPRYAQPRTVQRAKKTR